MIDAPYFHVVFTIPHELNPLFLANQKLLYDLLHKCCSETLVELSQNKRYLGALPGIIQVLHTWNQELDYHVHMHCIISGGGVTSDLKLRQSKDSFFIPVKVLRNKFRGKFLANLEKLYNDGKLTVPDSVSYLKDPVQWDSFRDSLYRKDWCPYIKETFNGFGNAIEYLGRYTNKIAISNSRIESVGPDTTTFSARGIRPGDPRRTITLKNTEFIRRFLLHVLPSGYQKIRYYGFLNNRKKSFYLRLIFELQGSQRFKSRFTTLSTEELMKVCFNVDIRKCPVCGNSTLETVGRAFASSA